METTPTQDLPIMENHQQDLTPSPSSWNTSENPTSQDALAKKEDMQDINKNSIDHIPLRMMMHLPKVEVSQAEGRPYRASEVNM